MKGYLVKFKMTGEERENVSKGEIIEMIIKKELLYDDLIWDKEKNWWIKFAEHSEFSKYFKEIKGKRKILVIEDEDALREFISDYFIEKNIDVVTAKNGKEGIYTARKELPDLIVLDIILPELSGWDVCKEIKKDERLKKIPVIMLTANSHPEHNLLGKSLGAVEYITKPFSIEELDEVVSKYL